MSGSALDDIDTWKRYNLSAAIGHDIVALRTLFRHVTSIMPIDQNYDTIASLRADICLIVGNEILQTAINEYTNDGKRTFALYVSSVPNGSPHE